MPFLFQTTRLRCRRWIRSDFDALFAVYSDPVAMRWVGEGKPISHEGCEKWFEVTETNYATRGYGMFALEDRASGEVVGCCGLVHPGGQEEVEIKYSLLRSHWGAGLATEVVPALLQYGTTHHALSRILATVDPDNLASQRVLAKAGAALRERRIEEDGSVTLVFEWQRPGAA